MNLQMAGSNKQNVLVQYVKSIYRRDEGDSRGRYITAHTSAGGTAVDGAMLLLGSAPLGESPCNCTLSKK